jgi:hypothetical protein
VSLSDDASGLGPNMFGCRESVIWGRGDDDTRDKVGTRLYGGVGLFRSPRISHHFDLIHQEPFLGESKCGERL